ncbi:PilW family protein [Leifsonia sp. Leaf264]|uniref:PilW family protein n=1 Tax=Leifsonia sp. Leaf264 TaxID=1736314 RepID=UPI0006FEAE97|nr:hypothetical protein [Leifsonia sp. Leaf264]KQO97398.1 hypothetical protein ASF30_13185 [Leifsonia sp. Leaf264]
MDRLKQHDEGYTLIELLIYVGLFLLVAFIVGSILLNSLRISATVTNSTSTVQGGQLIARSVDAGIRNATSLNVASVPGRPNDQLLRARSSIVKLTGSVKTTTWRCLAWYYDSVNQKVYTKSNSSAAVPVPAISDLTGHGWTLLSAGVTSSTTPFVNSTDSNGPKLTTNYNVRAGDVAGATYQTIIITLQQPDTTTGPTTCF